MFKFDPFDYEQVADDEGDKMVQYAEIGNSTFNNCTADHIIEVYTDVDLYLR